MQVCECVCILDYCRYIVIYGPRSDGSNHIYHEMCDNAAIKRCPFTETEEEEIHVENHSSPNSRKKFHGRKTIVTTPVLYKNVSGREKISASRDFTVCIIRCVYRAELILGR